MFADLLNQIRTRRQKSAQTATEQYQKLVTALADGDEPKPEEVERILDAAGRTPDELQAAVERLLQRREWRAMLDQKPKLEKKRAQLSTRREQEREKMREVRQEYELTMAALAAEISDIDAQIRRTDDAVVKLHETSNVAPQQAEISSRIYPITKKREALLVELRQAEAGNRQTTEYVGGEWVPRPGREEAAASYAAEVKNLQEQVADLDRKIEAAQSEVADLQQHALTA